MTLITKPDLDEREYKFLVLDSNKLSVLLISDTSTDKAAAALDVNVGHLSDPSETPGLAHFCEHLLFMGTTKYPVENEYSSFLAAHGGSSNAYTGAENTNYYFDVAADHLEGALDRFAQFFISPLFDDSCTERELQAVDSEHKKNIQQDTWRFYQLDKDTSHPGHPYTKFGTGNIETLKTGPESKGLSIRKVLLAFHSTFYSANVMKLVILGKEPIETLESWASSMFSPVVNKNVPIPVFPDHPLTADELLKITVVKPIRDMKVVDLVFPFPDLGKYYKSCPTRYLSHLIGHEGDGSILSYLKKNGWAMELSAGLSHGGNGFDYFKISVVLTDAGLPSYVSVIQAVFEYIQMLKNEGIKEWIFNECQSLARLSFKFKENIRPSSYASRLASHMHKYAPQDVLSGPYLLEEFSLHLIEQCLGYLRSDNFRVMLVTDHFDGVTWSKAAHYGTEYAIIGFPDSLKEALANPPSNRDLHLPRQNEFIPENFQVHKHSLDIATKPQIVRESNLVRFWYKKDDTFWVPKANCFLQLCSPLAYASPLNSVLTKLYCSLVADELNETAYYAQCAGLSFSLESTIAGILIHLTGYNDKMHVLLGTVLASLREVQFKAQRFDAIKEQTMREFQNFSQESPYHHSMYYMNQAIQDKLWTHEDKLSILKDLSLKEVQDFHPFLLKNIHIEGLVHGNIDLSSIQNLVSLVEKSFLTTKVLPPSQRFASSRCHIIPEKESLVYVQDVANPDNLNSSIEFYLQVGDPRNRALRAQLALFQQISSEPAFDQLRTKEQLGYIVFSGLRKQTAVIGYRIIVQSEKDPAFLESRIEVFLESVDSKLRGMTELEFMNHKTALITELLEKKKNLSQESQRIWNHIQSGYYDFEQHLIDAEWVGTLTLEEIRGFYVKFIKKNSESRRKLSVHIKSQRVTISPEGEQILRANRVVSKGDIDALKGELDLGPAAIPMEPLQNFVLSKF